jgi:hypothetical protein
LVEEEEVSGLRRPVLASDDHTLALGHHEPVS